MNTQTLKAQLSSDRKVWDFNYSAGLSGRTLKPVTDVARDGYVSGLAARKFRVSSFNRGFNDGLKGLNLDLMDEEDNVYHSGRLMGIEAAKKPLDLSRVEKAPLPTKAHSVRNSVLSDLTLESSWKKLEGLVTSSRIQELQDYHGKKSEQEQRRVIRRVLRNAKKA